MSFNAYVVNERKFEKIIVATILALPFVAFGLALLIMSAEAVDRRVMPILLYVVAIWLMGILPLGIVLCFVFRHKFDRERPGDSAIVVVTLGLAWPVLLYYYFAKEIAYWTSKLRQR